MTELLSDTLSNQDIVDAQTTIRAFLQEQDSTLDLLVGGPVDSILVNGNALIAARNDQQVDTAYLYQQLKQIADGTVTVDDADLDFLMANYFLTRIEDVASTGRVIFVVQDSQVYSFEPGYTIRYGDLGYQTTQSYTVYPPNTVGVDFTVETNIQLEVIYDSETGYSYRFELPFTAVGFGASYIRIAGDRFIPDQNFSNLGYAQAIANFTEGTEAETNAEFAARGLSGVLAATVAGESNIEKLVQSIVPRASIATVGAGEALMSRDRNNLFNISTGGKVDVYVKSGAISKAGYLVDAEVVDVGARRATITLTQPQSAGVYRLLLSGYSSTEPPVIATGEITVESVVHNAWDNEDLFNPEMPDEFDRAFSAHQEISITFTDTREDAYSEYLVDMTTIGQTLSEAYEVVTDYQPGVLEVGQLLESKTYRPPGTDVLVKAAVPCLTTVHIAATRPPGYSGPSGDTVASLLSAAINALPIGTAALDAYTIGALLKDIAPTVTLQSVTCTGTVYGQDDNDYIASFSDNKLTVPTDISAKISSAITYFVTTTHTVLVTLV